MVSFPALSYDLRCLGRWVPIFKLISCIKNYYNNRPKRTKHETRKNKPKNIKEEQNV